MKLNRIFWGLFFIAAAVLLLISQSGLSGGYSFWSIIMAIFFAACMIESIISKSISGILFSAAFLCIIFDKQLGIEAITPWPVLGAAFLGSIGCSFFYHPKKNHRQNHICGEDDVMKHYGRWEEPSEETVDGDHMDFHVSFSGSIKYVNSDNFQSANIQCSFGSLKIFFDNTLIQNNPAVVNLDVSFGGVQLYVPKTWNIIDHSDHIFGGIDEKGVRSHTTDASLVLNGTVKFAGLEIIYI